MSSSNGCYHPRQLREGNGFKLSGTYKDVSVSALQTDRVWTTEVLTFEIRAVVGGALTFDKTSAEAFITLTTGNYDIEIDESDSDLTALTSTGGGGSDGVYYWRLTETNTDGVIYTRMWGEFYLIDESGYEILQRQTDKVNVFIHFNGPTELELI